MTDDERERFIEEMEQAVADLHHYIKYGKYPERTPVAQFYSARDKVVSDILSILGLDEQKSAIARVALVMDACEAIKVEVTLVPQYPQLEKIYESLDANKPAMNVIFRQEQCPYRVDTDNAEDLPLHYAENLPMHGYQL